MMRPLLLALVPVVLAGAYCSRRPDAGPAAAATQPAAPNGQLTLVVTSGIVGHLEPCGCSSDQRGGVARAAAAVEAIRAEGRAVLLVDGGDRFFPSAASPADVLVANQQRLEAETMLQATRTMGYDALVLGARDAGNAAFFARKELPPILDLGAGALPQSRETLVIDRAGTKVGLFAIGPGPDAAPLLVRRAQELKKAGAHVLVLFAYMEFEPAKALLADAGRAGVNFVVATRAEVPETHESGAMTDGTPALLTIAARGEALLRLDLSALGDKEQPFGKIAGAAEREEALAAMQARIDLWRGEVVGMNPLDPKTKLRTDKLLELEERKAKLAASPPPPMPPGANAYTYAFVPMTPKLPKSAAVQSLVEEFHKSAARDNLSYVQAHPRACPEAAPGKASYTGDESCVDCHEEAFTFWKKTPHSHAYKSLVDKGRQYDVACVSCHVVGYEKPGGACSIADTKGRENVQCESCHGPGSLHVASGGAAKTIALEVPASACKSCHDPENSPHFNDATYRPQILGPGHGAPAEEKSAGAGAKP